MEKRANCRCVLYTKIGNSWYEGPDFIGPDHLTYDDKVSYIYELSVDEMHSVSENSDKSKIYNDIIVRRAKALLSIDK